MRKYLFIAAFFVAALQTSAQNDECAVQYSIYKEFLNVESYINAVDPFWIVADKCPQFSKSLYIDGVKIYKGLIAKTSDPALINTYVDTLKSLYHRRIENYGEESLVLGRCALDVMKLRKSDTAYFEAFHIFQQSQAKSNSSPELSTMAAYMQISASLACQNKITDDELFNALIPNIIEIKKGVSSGKIDSVQAEKVLTAVKNALAKVKNFKDKINPKFDVYAIPETVADEKILLTVMDFLGTDANSLYARIAEKLYETTPTPESAVAIARYARNIKDWNKAAKYYREAYENEKDNSLLSVYLYEAAVVANNLKKYSEVVQLCKKSIAANETNGAPFLLISAVYLVNGNSFGDDNFSRRQIYWVAADYAAKAKRVDPNLETEATSLISKCTAQFPNKEDAFMHSVKPGDVVKIKAFDEETTVARF